MHLAQNIYRKVPSSKVIRQLQVAGFLNPLWLANLNCEIHNQCRALERFSIRRASSAEFVLAAKLGGNPSKGSAKEVVVYRHLLYRKKEKRNVLLADVKEV